MNYTSALLFIVFLAIQPSCIKQKKKYANPAGNKSLFIAYPTTKLTNISFTTPLYKNLIQYYKQKSYFLSSTSVNAFVLHTTVTKIDQQYNCISPDILPIKQVLNIEILSTLLDTNKHVINKKIFTIPLLLPKAKNPVLNQNFFNTIIAKNFVFLSMQIEQYHRNFLIPG